MPFRIPGLLVELTEIRLNRVEGPAHFRTGWHSFTSLDEAQRYVNLIRTTAPTDGSYDKTDCELRFVDGVPYTLRLDVTHEPEFINYDFAGHMRRFLGTYSGRERPRAMTPEKFDAFLRFLGDEIDRAPFAREFDRLIEPCPCESGSTCTVRHDPGSCLCAQCNPPTLGASS